MTPSDTMGAILSFWWDWNMKTSCGRLHISDPHDLSHPASFAVGNGWWILGVQADKYSSLGTYLHITFLNVNILHVLNKAWMNTTETPWHSKKERKAERQRQMEEISSYVGLIKRKGTGTAIMGKSDFLFCLSRSLFLRCSWTSSQ